MSTDWRKAAFEEFAERRAETEREIAEAQAKVERFLTIARAREADLAALDKAAALLGIVSETPVSARSGSLHGGDTQGAGFKDLAIEFLSKNYPNSVRAAEVQNYVERKLLKKFHEKTAGMTLFRLSKDGIARRAGWDWYFVPEQERQGALPAEGGESMSSDI